MTNSQSKPAVLQKQSRNLFLHGRLGVFPAQDGASYKVQPARYSLRTNLFASSRLVNLQRGGIPMQTAKGQLFAKLHAQRHVAHQHGLRQRPGPIEVGAGRLAAFAGLDPFAMMPGRSAGWTPANRPTALAQASGKTELFKINPLSPMSSRPLAPICLPSGKPSGRGGRILHRTKPACTPASPSRRRPRRSILASGC